MNVRRSRFAWEVIVLAMVTGIPAGDGLAEQGRYFTRGKYIPKPLPVFEATKDKLPAPIYDEDPNYIKCYWKAWELAFRNFHEPAPQSGYVSQFIDAAFNQNIFLWDTDTGTVPSGRRPKRWSFKVWRITAMTSSRGR